MILKLLDFTTGDFVYYEMLKPHRFSNIDIRYACKDALLDAHRMYIAKSDKWMSWVECRDWYMYTYLLSKPIKIKTVVLSSEDLEGETDIYVWTVPKSLKDSSVDTDLAEDILP